YDSDMVADLLARTAKCATETVVSNADDGYVDAIADQLGSALQHARLGLSSELFETYADSLGYASNSPRRLQTGTRVTRISSREADLELADGTSQTVILPAKGVHFAVDVAAAWSAAQSILAARFDAS